MNRRGWNSEYALQFKRPINNLDCIYRRRQFNDFSNIVKAILPKDCDLCFHGTTLWNTKHILTSANISAAVDREKRIPSILDTPGQIDIATVESIEIFIQAYAGLMDDLEYPAGCIFVIKPKNEEEIKTSQSKYIGNIDLRRDAERIKAIISTPENIVCIREWILESGLNLEPTIVVDYDDFLKKMKIDFDYLDEEEKQR